MEIKIYINSDENIVEEDYENEIMTGLYTGITYDAEYVKLIIFDAAENFSG